MTVTAPRADSFLAPSSSATSAVNLEKLIEDLISGKPDLNLNESQVHWLCYEVFLRKKACFPAIKVLKEQPSLLELKAPINVVGDIHGQFFHLIQHFQHGGFPPRANYLFLGDYVDRGKNSLEVICLLLAYKIKYPENFFLLRGNHESAQINKIYGFYDDVKRRYSTKQFQLFQAVFHYLPIAAVINDKIFCCHGGISPELKSLDNIRRIQRPTVVPPGGLVCDLLWSDPDYVTGWAENDRGVSHVFGADVLEAFLQKTDLELVVRGHQVVERGYEMFPSLQKRLLVTVFSSPNYCGEFDNAGAMMVISDQLLISFKVISDVTKMK